MITTWRKYTATAGMSALEKINSGLIWLIPDIFLKVCTLTALLFMWRIVMESGAQTDMSVDQMLTYTYMSALLSELLVVQTAATGWLSDGVILKLYGRPLPVLAQLAAQTCGGWLPHLLFFSLPMAAVSPLFGISLAPRSALFLPSLLLCISLGFAIDAFFMCLSMKLRNMNWLVGRIRLAVVTLFSGTLIPVNLLPFGLANVMRYLPFASLGGAVLSLFTGTQNASETLALQLFWNLTLWPAALCIFKKSQEGMMSYGG